MLIFHFMPRNIDLVLALFCANDLTLNIWAIVQQPYSSRRVVRTLSQFGCYWPGYPWWNIKISPLQSNVDYDDDDDDDDKSPSSAHRAEDICRVTTAAQSMTDDILWATGGQ